MADFWTDVAAHPDGGFVRVVSEAGAVRVERDGRLLWRTAVPTDWLRFTRVAVSTSGRIVAAGQGGEGLAWRVVASGAESFGPTFGLFPVALRFDGETLHTYRCGPGDFVPVFIDGQDSGIRTHAVEGIRDVLPNRRTILFCQQTAAAVIGGRNFGQYTRKLGWCVGQSGNSIGCLHEASGHYFTARRGNVNEGIHFALQTNGDLAVAATTETGAFLKVFAPPYPAHEPLTVDPPPIVIPPEPEPMAFPNILSTLEHVRAFYPALITTEQAVEILNNVAWRHPGFGLLAKPNGNHGPQPKTGIFCSADWLVHLPSGRGTDCFINGPSIDAGNSGEAGTQWNDEGEPFDVSRFVAPVEPTGVDPGPDPEPEPEPKPEPTDLTDVWRAIQVLQATVNDLRGHAAQPRRVAIKSSRGRYLRDDWGTDAAQFDRDAAGDGETYELVPK